MNGRELVLTSVLAGSCLLGIGCESRAVKTAPTVEEAPHPTWKDASTYGYALELSSKVSLAGGGPLGELDTQGTVQLDTHQLSAERWQFAIRLTNATFPKAKEEVDEQMKGLAAELRSPFVFTLDRGVLSQVFVDPGWSPYAATIARTLAASFQFALPSAEDKSVEWRSKEYDATGSYEAEYRLGSDPLRISKKKLSYDAIGLGVTSIGLAQAKLKPTVVLSTGELKFHREAGANAVRLDTLRSTEKLKTQVTQGAPVTSETNVSLKYVREQPTSPALDWQQITSGLKRMAPGERHGDASPTDRYDADRIGDYTFESAMAELEAQVKDPRANQLSAGRGEKLSGAEQRVRTERLRRHGKVFAALTAILRRDPEHVPNVVTRIRAGSASSRALLDALSSASSPAAQAALVDLATDRAQTKPFRRAAAFSLIRSKQATPATQAALVALLEVDSLRVHALYGLGTMSRELATLGKQARVDAINAVLTAELKKAQAPAEKVSALRGIANSGNSQALPATRPFLTDPSDKVRAAAVEAVRLMPVPEAETVIAEALLDENSAVQRAALEALKLREPGDVTARALQSLAKTAKKPASGHRAIQLLGVWASKRPEFKDTLKELSEQSEEPSLRRAAAQALAK